MPPRTVQPVTTGADAPPPITALVPAPPLNAALATRQAQGTGRGTENLDVADLILPRLALVQRTSPEIDPTTDRFIEGAKFTDMVNSLTRENFGNGPITVIALGLPKKRAVEFGDGGVVIDRNVPLAVDPATGEFVDARLRFTGTGAVRTKPLATLFYDFPILVVGNGRQDLAILSMKGTQVRAAQEFISLINYRTGQASGKDVWDAQYTVKSVKKDYTKGPAAKFVITPAGASTDADATVAQTLFAMLQTKNVQVDDAGLNDADDGPDEKVPF